MKPLLASIMKMPSREGRQADDGLDVAPGDQVASDLAFRIAAKQHAVRQDARALAGAFERPHDVQQVGVVALLGRRCAERGEAFMRVVQRVEAGAPALVREWRIGDDVVERAQVALVHELRIGQRVALHDLRFGVVVQDHVHACQAGGGGVLLLAVDGELAARLVGHFQQQ
jgi:hypothetical protein